jgi:hypothetical protein
MGQKRWPLVQNSPLTSCAATLTSSRPSLAAMLSGWLGDTGHDTYIMSALPDDHEVRWLDTLDSNHIYLIYYLGLRLSLNAVL